MSNNYKPTKFDMWFLNTFPRPIALALMSIILTTVLFMLLAGVILTAFVFAELFKQNAGGIIASILVIFVALFLVWVYRDLSKDLPQHEKDKK